MGAHHTTICIGLVSNLDLGMLKAQPGVDLYHVVGSDIQDQIDMVLLDHFHCERTVVLVGGEEARREARAYGVVWVEDSPTVNSELLEFWRITPPVCDYP